MPGRGGRKLPEFLSRQEMERLLAVPNVNVPTGLRNRAVLELMYRCGLRVGEVCGIQVRDMKWDDQKVHLRPEITKGKVEAYVPVPEATMKGLVRWKAVRSQISDRAPEFLLTLKGTPITRFYVYDMVKRCGEKAGIEQAVHPHMLRHTFATEALSDGRLSIADVQYVLRHADVSTTSIYTHVSQQELSRKMRESGGEEW